MSFKNAMNSNLHRFLQGSVCLEKMKGVLWKSQVATAAFGTIYGCSYSTKNYSTSHLCKSNTPFVKLNKTPFVKFLVANVSSLPKFKPIKEQLFKRADKVPDDFSLIYKLAIENYVIYGRRLATICFICLFGISITKGYQLLPSTLEDGLISKHAYHAGDFIKSETEFFILFVSLVGFAAALNFVSSSIPIRVYHNPVTDEYVAILCNILGSPMKLPFSKSDAKKLKPSGVLPWGNSKFSIHSKKVILLEHYFRVPADYNALLGEEDHVS